LLLLLLLCLQTLMQQLEAAEAVPGDAPLRDHRPLQNNMDDYSRMCAVPREYLANFRDMPGVVTHADGGLCVNREGGWVGVDEWVGSCSWRSAVVEGCKRVAVGEGAASQGC
jgi:hypothetical protein